MSTPHRFSEDEGRALDAHARVQALLKLAESAWRCMDSRRAYEWKLALGLWTALAVFAGTVLKGDLPISRIGLYVASATFLALWAVFTFFWSKGLHDKNRFDRDLAERYWILAEAELHIDPPTQRATRRGKLHGESMWKNWSHLTQITVTSVFVILAIASMLLKRP